MTNLHRIQNAYPQFEWEQAAKHRYHGEHDGVYITVDKHEKWWATVEPRKGKTIWPRKDSFTDLLDALQGLIDESAEVVMKRNSCF